MAMGEEVTLTVRARSRSSVPVQFQLPTLDGFAVLASHDVTDVAVTGAAGPLRTTTRELHLRADRAGTLVIARIRPRPGTTAMMTHPICVTPHPASPSPPPRPP